MDSNSTHSPNGLNTTIVFMDYSELPLSARSQVLNNSDLLGLIFSFFHVLPQASDMDRRIEAPQSQQLLWAGLTCRTFSAPAMSVLWHSLESWTTLLCLIPTLVLDEDENLYTTDEAIVEEHLERLMYYAERVRTIKFTAFDEFVSTHIYASISRLCPNLFPRLSKLVIPNLGQLYRDNLSALFLMPTPSLSTVSVGGIVPATEVLLASMLVILSTHAKFLEHLDVSGELSNVTTDLLDRFKMLKSLQISMQSGSLDCDMLQKLSGLTRLKNLSLTLDKDSSFDTTSQSYASFDALESLELSGSVTAVFSILGKLSLSHLEDITIECPGSEKVIPSAQQLVRNFVRPQVTSSLRSFHMKLADSIRMTWKALMPLQLCKQLKHLSVSVEYLDASRLTSLCCNGEWFTLSSLELAFLKVLPGEVGLSVHDLRIFAEYCPKLTSLSISLGTLAKGSKAIEMLWEDGIKHKPFGDTELQTLEILPLVLSPTAIIEEAKEKSTSDAVAVSQYLYNLFPHLNEVTHPDECAWLAGVDEMIRVYQSISAKSKCTM
ncbi:hypothetical protein CPB84DRAFT_1775989 [Gymnopilus junonius]|uniref:Uncharacterized protein n=1 Tax=Gymnopilus junonius TaxID=109634 RepID=A0A9P5NPZ8_GYMJU|nr:hypothetical protein CPB84DRAFT_1775989 [Gymnopilus junonius]